MLPLNWIEMDVKSVHQIHLYDKYDADLTEP